MVIVACKADVRAELIQNISFKTRVNFWVLEKILAQSLQQIELILNTVNINKTKKINKRIKPDILLK